MGPLRLTVPKDAPPQLEKYLARAAAGFSLERVRELLSLGKVKVNGKVAKPGRRLWGGETVEIDVPAPRAPAPPTTPPREGPPLPVLFEDERCLVIDKPIGVVVEPDGHNPSVAELLAIRHQGFNVGGEMKPGLVHRIDRDTTGCVVVARTDAAMAQLKALFEAKTLVKTYRCLVLGAPEEQASLDTPFGHDPVNPRLFSSKVASPRRARLSYRTLERLGDVAWLEVHLDTGRTHQIRVQLADVGLPLLGDPVYGPKEAREHPVAQAVGRVALHAAKLHLGWEPPVTIEAPLPEDLRRGLELARRGAMSRTP